MNSDWNIGSRNRAFTPDEVQRLIRRAGRDWNDDGWLGAWEEDENQEERMTKKIVKTPQPVVEAEVPEAPPQTVSEIEADLDDLERRIEALENDPERPGRLKRTGKA